MGIHHHRQNGVSFSSQTQHDGSLDTTPESKYIEHDPMDLDVDEPVSIPDRIAHSTPNCQLDLSSHAMDVDKQPKNQHTNQSELPTDEHQSTSACQSLNHSTISSPPPSTTSSPRSGCPSAYSTPEPKDEDGTFTYFPQLPIELRIKIFGYAIPPPCTIQPRQYNGRFHMKPSERWTYQRKPPALLHTCRESRAEYLASYDEDVSVKTAQRGHPVYKLCLFNKLDPPTYFCAVYDSVGGCLEVISKVATRRELRSITLEEDLFRQPSLHGTYHQTSELAISCLTQFSSLETITFEVSRSKMHSHINSRKVFISALKSLIRKDWQLSHVEDIATAYWKTALGKHVKETRDLLNKVLEQDPEFRLRWVEYKLSAADNVWGGEMGSIRIKLKTGNKFWEDLWEELM